MPILKKIHRILSILFCFLLIFEQTGFAQVSAQLDIAGHLSSLRSSFGQDKFRPLHLRYLQYNPQDNNFRLLLDKGDSNDQNHAFIEETSKTLLKYFLIGLSLPNDSFWVNLRPDSPDNIIDPLLAQTDIGRIMLEMDLKLKKDTARMTSPETPEGKEYWNKLYAKAEELFGNQNITIPTLTRPWIVPDEIIVRESIDSAYVYKATLKVMLEQDYLKDSAAYNFADPRLKALNEYSSQLIREMIIPRLTKEVNISKRYAPLRQVYYSLLLAQWFKARQADKDNPYSRRIDRKDLTGLASTTPYSVETYFKAYKENFEKGEYNIKEPAYAPYGQVIRSYFSGGISGFMSQPQVAQKLTKPIGDAANTAILSAFSPVEIGHDLKPYLIPETSNADGQVTILPQESGASAGLNRLPKTGQMKAISVEDALDGDTELNLSSRHTEFESLVTPASAEDVFGTQARIVKADLGNAGAYHFNSNKYGLIIIVNSKYPQIHEEGEYHEVREIYWMSKGFNQHEAHVIASAEQIQRYSRQGELTPYHALQVQSLTPELRKTLLTEDRTWHHSVIEKAIGVGASIDIEKIIAYEETVRNSVSPTYYRIHSSATLSQGVSHIRNDIDTLLLALSEGSDPFPFSELSYKLGAIIQDYWGSTARERALSIIQNISERRYKELHLVEPAEKKRHFDDLVNLLLFTKGGLDISRIMEDGSGVKTSGERPKADQQSMLQYIANASKTTVTPQYIKSLIILSLEGERNTRDRITYYSWRAPEMFTDDAIKVILESARNKNAVIRRIAAIEIMEQLVYAGVPAALKKHSFLPFLIEIQIYACAEPVSLDKPFQLLADALKNNKNLAGDPDITAIIEKHSASLGKIRELTSGEYERYIQYAERKYSLLRQDIATMKGMPQPGQMKPISIRDQLEENIESNVSPRHSEFESLAAPVPAEYFFGTQARVVKTDLGDAGAYHFNSVKYGLIIVVNSRHPDIWEEGKFHEAREVYWMSKGFNQHEAHVIASAEQIQRFSKNGLLTPYHTLQIQNLSPEQREALQKEDRTWHRGVLKNAIEAGAMVDTAIIESYERKLQRTIARVAEDTIMSPESSLRDKENSGMGGIDFRNLPIVTQAIGNLHEGLEGITQTKLQGIDLSSELQQIEWLVNSGITPSTTRIKEFIQAATLQDDRDNDLSKVVSCISDIFRLDEDRCSYSDPVLKDILVVLESGKNTQELKAIFTDGIS